MNARIRYLSLIAAVFALIPLSGNAITVAGTVYNDEKIPEAGALLTLASADGLYAQSVYSDADGKFELVSDVTDGTLLRARKPGFADAFAVANDRDKAVEITLRTLTSPLEISNNLTASAHFTKLEFDDPVDEGFFRVECLTCHQLGNLFTRMPRSRDLWLQIVERMLAYYGVSDKAQIDRYADMLVNAFDGRPVTIDQEQQTDPAIFSAKITQWKLPEGVIAHDVEQHSVDGKFYTVDQGRDQIYITDPETNLTETYRIADGGIPMGGKFLEVMDMANPYGLAVSRGPHSLQEGPDGKFYTTDTVSGQIGVFDPKTREYTGHDIGGNAMYPHTLRFDTHGQVWFTLGVSNQVGRFDPATGDMILIELPTTTDRPETPALMPYGIDVHPIDGSIWYTRLMANRIGRIDPESLEVEEFTPPLIGPRRMRFASDGTLWIPAYATGALVKLDTETMEYKTYPIPTLSPDELEVPYALGVHPRTQEVWITANMSDRVFHFLPDEERFIAYPLPTRGIFLRDMVFTREGAVCAASSTVPAPLVVEGGMEEIICIDP